MSEQVTRVVIEADGGSRGNPGPAAYGALVKDADTGRVLAEEGTAIGVASNNVAEYSGLIAGLRMAEQVAPGADIEVRMDSKLVVEQMSGNWKIKHPDMKPLALEANRLAPFGTTYTWMPREQNKHADRLANEALDGLRSGVTIHLDESDPDARTRPTRWSRRSRARRGRRRPRRTSRATAAGRRPKARSPRSCSSGTAPPPTPPTSASPAAWPAATPGSPTRAVPRSARSPTGWPRSGPPSTAVVASPVRRTRESAEILAERLDLDLVEEPGFAEMEFGTWDGLTFGEVRERFPEQVQGWLGNLDVAPGGGESFLEVEARVLAGLERVIERYAGQTVLVVSHVTPIKTLVAHAVDAPLSAVFRMELSTASVSVVSFFGPAGRDGDTRRGSMRLYNAQPPGAGQMLDPQRW